MDVVELIMEDHREVERLFEECKTHPHKRPLLTPVVCALLAELVGHHVHEEESTVLPGMRERLDDARRAELGKAFAESRERHLGERPGQATKEELLQQARNAGLSGASGMSRDQLAEALREQSS